MKRNSQKLRHKRSNTIAISIDFLSHRHSHISDPLIFELMAGVSEALGEHNQDLLLTAPNHNNSKDFQQILLSRGIDGFIFLGQGQREDMLMEFAKLKSPMVVWGAKRKKESYCVVGSGLFMPAGPAHSTCVPAPVFWNWPSKDSPVRIWIVVAQQKPEKSAAVTIAAIRFDIH